MGDALSAIFGGGSRGSQDVSVDPQTQQMNQLKLDQFRKLLGYGGSGQGYDTSGFMQPSDAYKPSSQVTDLLNYGSTGGDYKLMSYDDYLASGNRSTDVMNAGVANSNDLLNRGVDNNNNVLNTGIANSNNLLGAGLSDNVNTLNAGLNNVQSNTDTALQQGQNRYYDEYKKAYDAGLNTTSNYISQIATPQIKQAMVLQGLEGGGAVPEAISKATATVGSSYMQSLMEMAKQYLAQQGGIQESNKAQQAGLYNTAQGIEGQMYDTAQGQQGSMYNTAQQGQTSLYGAAQNEQSSMYQNEASLQNAFAQSLPSASINLAAAPSNIQSTRAQTAATLFPMADYGRNLQQQDLERRQGLVQTAMTGIPYTPSTSTQQRTGSQPLFNWFGQG